MKTETNKMLRLLISTRDRIDKEIEALQHLKAETSKKSQGSKRTSVKKRSSRKKNEHTLEEAILKTLTPKRGKRTKQVVETIEQRGLYKSKNKTFSGSVNATLNNLAKRGIIEKDGMDFKLIEGQTSIPKKKRRGRPKKAKNKNKELNDMAQVA